MMMGVNKLISEAKYNGLLVAFARVVSTWLFIASQSDCSLASHLK